MTGIVHQSGPAIEALEQSRLGVRHLADLNRINLCSHRYQRAHTLIYPGEVEPVVGIRYKRGPCSLRAILVGDDLRNDRLSLGRRTWCQSSDCHLRNTVVIKVCKPVIAHCLSGSCINALARNKIEVTEAKIVLRVITSIAKEQHVIHPATLVVHVCEPLADCRYRFVPEAV